MTRLQKWVLECMPEIELKSGILGKKVTDDTKSVKIYFEGRYIAKAYGMYLKTHSDCKTKRVAEVLEKVNHALKRNSLHHNLYMQNCPY